MNTDSVLQSESYLITTFIRFAASDLVVFSCESVILGGLLVSLLLQGFYFRSEKQF